MPRDITCGSCDARFAVDEDNRDPQLGCPYCQAKVANPALSATVETSPPTAPAELPGVPVWKVVAVADERDYSRPHVVHTPEIEPATPDVVDIRQYDPLGVRRFLIRLAVLGAIGLALVIGFAWGEASLVMSALLAVGLLPIISVGIVLTRRPRGSTAAILGWVILGLFAALGLLLALAALMFMFMCLFPSRPSGMRFYPN
jgi:hypothetical protein